MGALIAFSVGLVVYGYTWRHSRNEAQRFAYSSIVGVLGIPIAGAFWDKMLFRYFGLTFNKYESNVNDLGHVLIWGSISGIVFWLDYRFGSKPAVEG